MDFFASLWRVFKKLAVEDLVAAPEVTSNWTAMRVRYVSTLVMPMTQVTVLMFLNHWLFVPISRRPTLRRL